MAVHVVGVVAMVAFYLLILLVGLWAARKTRRAGHSQTTDDVMLAGRNIGPIFGPITMTATWVGGSFINGSTEMVTRAGLLNCQAPFGYSLSLLIETTYIAARCWRAGRKRELSGLFHTSSLPSRCRVLAPHPPPPCRWPPLPQHVPGRRRCGAGANEEKGKQQVLGIPYARWQGPRTGALHQQGEREESGRAERAPAWRRDREDRQHARSSSHPRASQDGNSPTRQRARLPRQKKRGVQGRGQIGAGGQDAQRSEGGVHGLAVRQGHRQPHWTVPLLPHPDGDAAVLRSPARRHHQRHELKIPQRCDGVCPLRLRRGVLTAANQSYTTEVT